LYFSYLKEKIDCERSRKVTKMTMPAIGNRVTAVFDNHTNAEQAVIGLRQIGIGDNQFSVITQDRSGQRIEGGGTATTTEHHGDSAGERATKGALAGATAGAVFGLAALAIPGVGPFITAGFLAEALGVTGGAIAAGAIVGGTSGALAGALTRAGYEEPEAQYYSNAIEQGSVFVAVDTQGGQEAERVRSLLTQHGGRLYQRSL
jgi:hypothetical protein